ncbi:hypothetical protein N657DRAFT_663640 [Parathielavia appendiculata]|uniref:VanZ-like domain-containing protein n=1 Tax=Parathielavia appendiculata TaxID=2587402 RepID=A0AAN6Z4L8_9PEZI|nr:hypothetical protein N657DRAFT_663640 [Parathielavia appendiculata]
MRIRLPFAGAFATLLLLAGYTSLLTPHSQPSDPDGPTSTLPTINPLLLHFLTLFTLTVAFYWSLDTTRRRILHLTLLCAAGLGIGSEFLRAIVLPPLPLPSHDSGQRAFDLLNVLANLAGSFTGLGLCAWYHKRMLERKRLRKYTAVPTTGGEGGGVNGAEDLELGEGPGLGGRVGGEREEGVVTSSSGGNETNAGGGGGQGQTLEEEVDNWDENAIDAWDEEEEDAGDVGAAATPAAGKDADVKKRAD